MITLRDLASDRAIGGEVPVERAALPVPETLLQLKGNLDQVTLDGWVSGWCWYPNAPERTVELTVLADDEPVGQTRAANYRADLEEAGVGDGAHAFSFAMPWAVMSRKGSMTVAVRDVATGQALGEPVTLRLGALTPTEERIEDLERQLRILRSELGSVSQEAQTRGGERAARDLFRTVASFFQELADSPSDGGLMAAGLRGALSAFAEQHSTVTLAIPEAPAATIVIDAVAPATVLYHSIAMLKSAGVDQRADIVLLDGGAHGGEAALLPSVVRNLRYHRLSPGRSFGAGRNEAVREARGGIVVFLSPETRPDAGLARYAACDVR